MKKSYVLIGLLLLFIASCSKNKDLKTKHDTAKEQHNSEQVPDDTKEETSGPATIDVFPVRGLHNSGYDRSLDGGSKASWNCNRGYSNSDFVAGDHLGIDIGRQKVRLLQLRLAVPSH